MEIKMFNLIAFYVKKIIEIHIFSFWFLGLFI